MTAPGGPPDPRTGPTAGAPVQIRRLRTPGELTAHARAVGADLPVADPDPSVLGTPWRVDPRCPPAGNRFVILPMEGWDGTTGGRPTDLVLRRWRRFGGSGAGLLWGGEAVAVVPEGRANPRQLVIGPHVADLLEAAVDGHAEAAASGRLDGVAGAGAPPVVGLQLTHSGRYSHFRPRAARSDPVLDRRRPAEPLTDGELDDLVGAYVDAATVAADAGFAFVDVKACHGYLGHELLGPGRPGPWGGDLDGRMRFLTRVVGGIRASRPALGVGVRLSVFDVVPHRPGPGGVGVPDLLPGDPPDWGMGLTEGVEVVSRLAGMGVGAVCVTAGSPYTCPHVQRPAWFPPSDGYLPPEDPLVGVARLLEAARVVRAAVPGPAVVASGVSYTQEWVGHVATGAVAGGWCDAVGLGRMALSYPDLPADVLAGRPPDRRRLCRTFSDCTTAPRNGLVSGCFPLDPFYKAHPDRAALAAVKRSVRRALPPGGPPHQGRAGGPASGPAPTQRSPRR